MRRERLKAAFAAVLACGATAVVVVAGGLLVSSPAGADTGAPVAEETSVSPTETPAETEIPTPTTTQTTTATPTPTPTPTPTVEPTTGVKVDDAVLRWGLNNESSNRAFAPRTFNFLSAGRIPDPGRGGQTIGRSDWSQRRGAVAIEKWDGRRWRPATWAGLSTDSSGALLGSPTSGTFSNHTMVLRGGSGLVDTDAGTAHVEWDGDVSVLYYSGMSFFYLSDPVLDVADGRGRITASVSGFASSLEDQSQWESVAARQVVLADLPSVDLDDARGFVATPAYLGVTVTGVEQDTEGVSSGAFPQSYVDMMRRLGTAAFWHSSGSATDPFKVALPLTVNYDAARTVEQPIPSEQPTATPVPTPTVITPPPPPPVQPQPPAIDAPPVLTPPALAPGVDQVPLAAAPVAAVARPPTQVRLTSLTPLAEGPAERPWLWWLGGVLLLAAARVLLIPADPTPDPATP